MFKYCFRDSFPELQGGTRELSKIFFDKISIMRVDSAVDKQFKEIILEMQSNPNRSLTISLDNMIFDLYDLTKEERDIIGLIEIQ